MGLSFCVAEIPNHLRMETKKGMSVPGCSEGGLPLPMLPCCLNQTTTHTTPHLLIVSPPLFPEALAVSEMQTGQSRRVQNAETDLQRLPSPGACACVQAHPWSNTATQWATESFMSFVASKLK